MGTNRVGRNHHKSTFDYVYDNNGKYFVSRAYEFIHNRETSVAVYARIRAGICKKSQSINILINCNCCSKEIKRRDKDLLKELSKALSALDTYFQDLVDRGTLDMILSDALNFAKHYGKSGTLKDVLLGEDNE